MVVIVVFVDFVTDFIINIIIIIIVNNIIMLYLFVFCCFSLPTRANFVTGLWVVLHLKNKNWIIIIFIIIISLGSSVCIAMGCLLNDSRLISDSGKR
jgi:hypothetical protein